MEFNKEAFKAEVKEKLKIEGKEHLMEFAEDVAEMGWEIVKIAAKHNDITMDEAFIAMVDGAMKNLIDGIDGKVDQES